MQNTGVNRVWEILVADGTYAVHLAMGDPQFVSHTNNVYIEDVLQQDTAGTATGIDEFDATVEVTDGRLTIRPGQNEQHGAKIMFIHITRVSQVQEVDLISSATFSAHSAGWDTSGEWIYSTVHDGNINSEAHGSGAAEYWIEYNFGSAFTLTRMRVYEDDSGTYSLASWKAMYHDGTQWVNAFEYRSASSAGWHEVTLQNIVTSRVRFYGKGNNNNLEIYEFECYGVSAV
jgi:hypothetical protein